MTKRPSQVGEDPVEAFMCQRVLCMPSPVPRPSCPPDSVATVRGTAARWIWSDCQWLLQIQGDVVPLSYDMPLLARV